MSITGASAVVLQTHFSTGGRKKPTVTGEGEKQQRQHCRTQSSSLAPLIAVPFQLYWTQLSCVKYKSAVTKTTRPLRNLLFGVTVEITQRWKLTQLFSRGFLHTPVTAKHCVSMKATFIPALKYSKSL